MKTDGGYGPQLQRIYSLYALAPFTVPALK